MHIVYENIYFAIGIKLICLLLGALGIANMWMAIFADVGVMVIAVVNAIRALFVKNMRCKKNSQRKNKTLRNMGKELPCYGGFCFAYQSSVRRTGFALRGHDISGIGKRMAREAEDT